MAPISRTKMRTLRIKALRNKKSGFTLIELMVVCMILVLIAGFVVPNVISMKASDDYHSTVSAIRRMALDARERAISSGKTEQLVYDDSAKAMEIQQLGDDGTATTQVTTPIADELAPTRFEIEGKDVASADFKLTFGADGHSNGGGIEFPNLSVWVDQNGAPVIVDGALPEPTDRRWQAGELEQRS